MTNRIPHCIRILVTVAIFFCWIGNLGAQETTLIVVQPSKLRQVFEGLGAGAIFFEAHITSLSERNKHELQEQLYDDLFTHVPTRFLQLMIRETHEPQNDNDDPLTPAFEDSNFEYCRHTIQIAKAALKRQPKIQFLATLYTPPAWMKTNNDVAGGGESRATVKNGLELELAEYIWAFLAHMQKNGVTVQYLSIANEPDFPHTQPGYSLSADKYASLFKSVAEYLDKMKKKYPEVPRPKLVGPNTLSAPVAAIDYVPLLIKTTAKNLDVIGSHDYDPHGDRWGALKKLGGSRPIWMTEWCARTKDASPGMIHSATEYGAAMHDAFQGGANVFMAYDWVYPPRDSGEGLIHVNWGNDYSLTKLYYLFRQWAAPLLTGMRVVESSAVGPGAVVVKPTAFFAQTDRMLIVHLVNTADKDVPIKLKLNGAFATATTAARHRTSATEDASPLLAISGEKGTFTDTLPSKSMVTYRLENKAK